MQSIAHSFAIKNIIENIPRPTTFQKHPRFLHIARTFFVGKRECLCLGPIASADWWSNGTQIVTASWDRTVKLWDVEEEKVIHTLEGNAFAGF